MNCITKNLIDFANGSDFKSFFNNNNNEKHTHTHFIMLLFHIFQCTLKWNSGIALTPPIHEIMKYEMKWIQLNCSAFHFIYLRNIFNYDFAMCVRSCWQLGTNVCFFSPHFVELSQVNRRHTFKIANSFTWRHRDWWRCDLFDTWRQNNIKISHDLGYSK